MYRPRCQDFLNDQEVCSISVFDQLNVPFSAGASQPSSFERLLGHHKDTPCEAICWNSRCFLTCDRRSHLVTPGLAELFKAR